MKRKNALQILFCSMASFLLVNMSNAQSNTAPETTPPPAVAIGNIAGTISWSDAACKGVVAYSNATSTTPKTYNFKIEVREYKLNAPGSITAASPGNLVPCKVAFGLSGENLQAYTITGLPSTLTKAFVIITPRIPGICPSKCGADTWSFGQLVVDHNNAKALASPMTCVMTKIRTPPGGQ